MFRNIYQGRRVFVTGHTGFKGSWLCAWLHTLGAEVAGYALAPPSDPALFHLLPLNKYITHYDGDIRNSAMLAQTMREFRPEIVFHLAAQALVRLGHEQPVETIETNVLGTLHVLEALRHIPDVRALVCVTSDKCYANREWLWGYRENDPLGGDDPYSASKACAEHIIHAYTRSFYAHTPLCASVRAGNVLGGGDWGKDRIVPDCVRAWVSNTPLSLRNPHGIRPWQHVLEPLSGYLWLGARLFAGEKALHGEAFNFAPHACEEHTVSHVTEELKHHWDGLSITVESNTHQSTFFSENPAHVTPNTDLSMVIPNTMADSATTPHPHPECTFLSLNCDKAQRLLQWHATLQFEECLRYTAEWYRAWHTHNTRSSATIHKADMWAFTLGQIAAYTTSAQHRELLWSQE